MKKIILFACASLFILNVEGQGLQNKILEHLGYVSDSSIVREWRDNYCVLYTSNTSGNNYFHLVDMATGAVSSFEINGRVADMVVIGDTLYYCGNTLIGYPTVGEFYIPSVLTNSIIVHYLYCPTLHTIVPKRMDAIRVSNGFHIFMTGNLIYSGSSGPVSFVADASRHTTPGTWRVFYYTTWGKECFEDVTATDNYIVTTGHIDNTPNVVVRVFERPNNVSFLNPPTASHHHMFYNSTLCSNMYIYSGNAMKPIDQHGYHPISITHTLFDTVAVAYLAEYKKTFGLTIKTIDVSTGAPIPHKEINATWTTEKYNVKDIRYNKITDSLLVLQERRSNIDGSTRGYLVMTDNSTFTTLTDVEPTLPVWVRSLDKFYAFTGSTIFCGEVPSGTTNTPVLNASAIAGMTCFVRTSETFSPDTFTLTSDPLLINPSDSTFSNRPHSTTILLSTMNIHCHENN